MGKHGRTLAQRLEDNTYRPHGANGCWEWTGARSPKGYGSMKVDRKSQQTHRLSYELEHGALDPSVSVLHTCDNPPCWNPAHLRPGTVQDNSDDMTEKLRQNRGSARPAAKLTEELVAAMHQDRVEGMKQRDIAAKYGVHQSNVSRALNGEQWAHVR